MAGITLQEVGGELVINVPEEATVIGRGQFLQVTDKRVSRSHALLEITDGKLYITPTHTNPCFLRTLKQRESKVLSKDVKQLLDDGDEFGLLADQLFFKVKYPQVNGKEREGREKEEVKASDENSKSVKNEKVTNGDAEVDTKPQSAASDKDVDEDWDKAANEADKLKSDAEPKKEVKDVQQDSERPEKSELEVHDDMAMPLSKKRVLPAWMVQAAGSPVKAKTPAKKPISTAVSKRPAGKPTVSKATEEEDDNDDDDDDDFLDDEEEEYIPQKSKRRKGGKDSDEDYEDEPSDDDYMPTKSSRSRGGRSRRKRKASDSEDDFSEDDDDYSPKKSKPKAKKTPKGKGGAKGRKAPARTPRKTPQRSRGKRKNSDDEDEEISIPRRQSYDDEEEEDSPSRRPQRAARQKRGSYVDDPMIEEALEDFASDDDDDANEDKDSDFQVEGEEDSGSDWEKKASSSQRQKAAKIKGKVPPRGPTKRGAAGKGKKKGRRPSRGRARDDSDEDDDDDIMEDDEPYVPRPTKRRGGAASRDTDDSDEGTKKRRRRERCQYGKKCYRKNPVHFRTFCHPGDSSYDEDETGGSSPKPNTKKEKESSRVSPEKPSRPQRSTAGTRLVTHGVDDDDLPDTYDYNDSFIDDGTQQSEESAGDDSDYDAEEDVRDLARDAKKFLKNKKMAKTVGSD